MIRAAAAGVREAANRKFLLIHVSAPGRVHLHVAVLTHRNERADAAGEASVQRRLCLRIQRACRLRFEFRGMSGASFYNEMPFELAVMCLVKRTGTCSSSHATRCSNACIVISLGCRKT